MYSTCTMYYTYLTLSVISITIVSVVAYRKLSNNKPRTWKKIGKISELCIYPLKSGYRINVNKAECTDYGVRQMSDKSNYQLRDRNFIVYDANTKLLVTGRKKPEMVLIKISKHDSEHVAFDFEGMRTLYVKVPEIRKSNISKCTLHDNEQTEMVDCGDEAAVWFSRCLSEDESALRLGYYDEKLKKRIVDKCYNKFYPNFKTGDMGMFSDLCSYMLINQESVLDLNTKLSNPVTAYQFRPNIILTDCTPYDEDNWKMLKIGEVLLENVKPCSRCTFTTVDVNGVRSKDCEPLKTLRTYRQIPDLEERKSENYAPIFGVNLALRKAGVINVDDVVYASE